MTSTFGSGSPAPTDPEQTSATTKILAVAGTLVVLGAIAWGAKALVGDDPGDGEPLPAATGRPLTPWRPTGAARAPGEGGVPATADRPVVLFDGLLTIDDGLGVDVDRADPDKKEQGRPATGSAASTLDVYWAQKGGLSVNDGSLFIDQEGLPEGAAQRCAARVASGQEGYPTLDVFAGDQFCLRTSEGRIAWLRVGEGAGRDDELAVTVTVWDGVPE